MRQGGDVGLVDQAGLGQVAVGQGRGGRRSEHGADVDGHVEEAESGIALGGILRVVIEIAGHHLEVALEQTRADGDEQQGADHQGERQPAVGEGIRGDREEKIAEEHNGYAGDDTLAESDLVGKPSAEDRHEIDGSQENGVELAGRSSREAELRL